MASQSQSSPENRHEPALDGIRGLAILLVLLSHAADFLGPVPHGEGAPLWGIIVARTLVPAWGGVDLFFTLSGFLITGILLRARGKSNYFSSFYMRRALRIFPIYYFVLILSLLLSDFSNTFAAYIPHRFSERLSYFFYIANWPVFWLNWAGMSGLWGAYWSLNVEEQFYLVWPTLVRWLKPSTMMTICIIGFACGWFERGLLVSIHGIALGILQWPFSRLDGLFLGSILATYRFQKGRPIPFAWAVISFSAGTLLYASVAFLHPDELVGTGVHLWQTGIAAFALMSAGLVGGVEHGSSGMHRLFSWTPLRIAGRYSYGMYIYHLFLYSRLSLIYNTKIKPSYGTNPVVSFAYILLAIALTTLVAAISFRFLETPFLRLKRLFPSPAPSI